MYECILTCVITLTLIFQTYGVIKLIDCKAHVIARCYGYTRPNILCILTLYVI